MKILWIEDDAAIISPVMNPIRQAGVSIEIAESYEEARSALAGDVIYDMFVVDLIIPRGGNSPAPDGYVPSEDKEYNVELYGMAIIKIIRGKYPGVPIFVLTAIEDNDVAQYLQNHGARVLRKPISPSALKHELLGH